MSDKKENVKSAEETKYSVNEICENSVAVFGKKKEVIIGALHNAKLSFDGEYTKSEVQKAIDTFLKKEVK